MLASNGFLPSLNFIVSTLSFDRGVFLVWSGIRVPYGISIEKLEVLKASAIRRVPRIVRDSWIHTYKFEAVAGKGSGHGGNFVHRGPDQQGVFSSNLFSFGAARTKIIHDSAHRSTDNSSVERASNCR